MDFILTQGYRLVLDDLVLISDVAWAYYPISRAKSESFRSYIHGLTKSLLIVVQKESEEIESQQLLLQNEQPRGRSNSSISTRSTASKKVAADSSFSSSQNYKAKVVVIREVLWEFIRSVVIPLTAEELSQYPFWAAKVVLVASESHKFTSFGDSFHFWCSALYSSYKSANMTNIFLGSNIPYLAAALVSNNEHVAVVLKNYFKAALSMIPKSLSESSSYDLFRKASSKSSSKFIDNSNRNSSSDSGNYDDGTQARSSSSTSKIVNKVISVIAAQPMLILSVDMLTNRTLTGLNWLNSALQILRYKGHLGFLRGFRASLIFTVLPISPVFLCGLSETVMYRCINGYGRSMSDQSGGVLSVAQHMLEAEGSKSLLQYGYISALQIIPGFLAFAAARSMVWLTCGSSKHRVLIVNRRKQTVLSLWQ